MKRAPGAFESTGAPVPYDESLPVVGLDQLARAPHRRRWLPAAPRWSRTWPCRGRRRGSRRRRAGRTGRGRRGRWRTPPPCARCRRTAGWCRRRSRRASPHPRRAASRRRRRRRGSRCAGGSRRWRWEAELAATLSAADDDPLDAVRAAQDLARALHIALGDQPPGQGGGERLTAPGGTAHVQLHHLDVEVVRLALLAQEVDIAGRLVAETEVRALDDGLGVQLVDEDLGHEVGGRQLRELGGEGEDEQRVHTQIGAQLGAAVVRGEQRGWLPGRTTSLGCGSKVTTTEGTPSSRARSTACLMISWCPRCTPS